ncbi:hypothetical protein [Idiomarina xiamenensis]|uniref:Adenylosuccinate synthase n=1 Tax=Idiomarina xiamenensis 10-D-4 TaxID=740709 RepID=K2JXQ9_9GAMM|nr:hypothetical protein [Idiomarina xiamenensis]EKE79442.1 adenylosuccinate synthase [Idiomarina xiamenensis 10-D-4]
MRQLTHKQLCEIAVKWLKRPNSAKGHGCHVAVAEVKSGHDGEIPDAIGFRCTGDHTDGSVVVEVKVSRQDFLNDFKKPHRNGDVGMGNWRYYMAPIGLISENELPAKWGLVEVNRSGQVKNIIGPAGIRHYSLYKKNLDNYRHDSNISRELFLMVRLLARIEDAHKESSQIKEIYRANRILAKRNSKLKTDKFKYFSAKHENEQLQQRVVELEREATIHRRDEKANARMLHLAQEECNEWKRKKFARFADDECWLFTDDGYDNLHSLVCPVVMHKEKAIELVKARQERDALAAHVERLNSAINQYMDVVDDGDFDWADKAALESNINDVQNENPAQSLQLLTEQERVKAYRDGFMCGYNQEECLIEPAAEAKELAQQYAKGVKGGENV